MSDYHLLTRYYNEVPAQKKLTLNSRTNIKILVYSVNHFDPVTLDS